MEINEKNGFSIVGFIAQVLVILLFVFVLMWLFPTKSYLENNGTAGTGEGNNSALTELLFNQNLSSMKDAAREYYTVKRMPATNGASKKMTLDEMIKNSMVVEFVDAKGNKCDRQASYVKVTKVDKEYEMEISLTCGNVTKTIKTTVGCYNYCESGLCEKQEVTLYQYEKTTPGTTAWTSWSKWGKTEVKETSTKKVEKKVVNEKVGETTTTKEATSTTTYSCPDNTYTLSADKKTCTKGSSTTSTVASKATTSYTCPDNTYTLSADKKTCTKTNYSYAELIPVYTCAQGSLSGTQCVITYTKVATPHMKITFDCSAGACQSVSKIDYYYCTDTSYSVSGKTCVKKVRVNATLSDTKCPDGYNKTSDGTRCVKGTPASTSSKSNTTYSCADKTYTLSADKKSCSKVVPTTATVASSKNVKYSCATGKLNNQNKCDVVVAVYKDVTYYRYKTLVTTKAKTVYKWSTSSNDQALIKAGYKYTGVTKTKTSK